MSWGKSLGFGMLSAEDVEPVLSEAVKERFVIIRIEFHGNRPGILLIANYQAEYIGAAPRRYTPAPCSARIRRQGEDRLRRASFWPNPQ